MAHYQPFQVLGFHSCDKQVGLDVLSGKMELKPSNNPWDWLGQGIYFWEQSPERALEYAIENAKGEQFNKVRITTPFVIGAIIELGNCLNLIEPTSINILTESFGLLLETYNAAGKKIPVNKDSNRRLDCEVIKFVHESTKKKDEPPYDTVRSPFNEGEAAYPGASFTSRGHIQVCVLNPQQIKGYFLPRPLQQFNPFLH